ncbi:hypothetical protein AAFF_G00099900 [Aldrovandia affinis]|uniref:Uncharacterized protein n=1 Tax=Aldrovandia affinis TaxID=143900 RepID=A0AAD7RVB8_9TELE|nr:hypothetical protein AAFF_G00099900 [Aldrovandia affinis]
MHLGTTEMPSMHLVSEDTPRERWEYGGNAGHVHGRHAVLNSVRCDRIGWRAAGTANRMKHPNDFRTLLGVTFPNAPVPARTGLLAQERARYDRARGGSVNKTHSAPLLSSIRVEPPWQGARCDGDGPHGTKQLPPPCPHMPGPSFWTMATLRLPLIASSPPVNYGDSAGLGLDRFPCCFRPGHRA